MTTTLPPLTRLERAKAALEEAVAAKSRALGGFHSACAKVHHAREEIAAAELAAAAQPQPVPPPLPDALVEVARKIEDHHHATVWSIDGVLAALARSHGVSVDALRAAMKEAQRGGA